MSTQIGGMSDAVGGDAALAAIKAGGGGGTARAIEVETAQLPPAVAAIVGSIGGSSKALVRQQASGELAGMYQGEVVKECNAIAAGRYPFVRNSGSDVPVADFARLFGTGGVYDTFFRAHLVELIDTNVSPWRWREAGGDSMGLPASIPGQFEAVDRIRQQFFKAGGADPEVRYSLTPEYLDADVGRLVVEAGDQRFEYSHGPQTQWPLKWPAEGAPQIAVTFDTGSGPGNSAVFDGPWALFRMLDASNVQAQGDVRFLVTVTAGAHTTRLRLDASSIRNPFAAPALTRFRCGG
jgi:type VI secretion system protein ImpL